MERKITKKYSNGEVTVVWKPDVCIHSAICFRGLPQVFNPKEKPWVKIEGASTQAIMDQVDKCPSGALSYIMNDRQPAAQDTSTDTMVEVSVNGPLMIHGNIIIKDAGGSEIRREKVTALCRCGGSGNKPYCDGTHRKIEFKG